MTQRPHVSTDSAPLATARVAELARAWVLDGEIQDLSPRTLEERQRVTEKLCWFLAQDAQPALTTTAVRGFLAYLRRSHEDPAGRWGTLAPGRPAQPLAAATHRAYYRVIRAFCNWLIAEEEIDRSPLASLRPPPERAHQVQPFTGEQMDALITAARNSHNPRRDEAIVLLLWDTGMRASELCGLREQDVDYNARRCRVLGKGRKERTLPLGRRTTRALWNYQNSHPAEPDRRLFTGEQGPDAGSSLHRHGLGKLIRRLGAAANLSGVRCSPHTFRHTFAIDWLRNGGDVFTLQELLGHTTLAMVRRYVQLAQADLDTQHRRCSPADRHGRRRER